MAIALATNPPSFSGSNPFQLMRAQPDAFLSYTIKERAGHIAGIRYQIFERIFHDRTREWDFIADSAAAEVVQLSHLPDDILAGLWEEVRLQFSFYLA
jgi:hypothetical protein